jgi:hypothetical protein
MIDVNYVIQKIYPNIQSSEYQVLDKADGNGPQIVSWTSSYAKPTQQQIQTVWNQNLLSYEWIVPKQKRDSLLQASDWTQLPDITGIDKQAWAQYRQQLRDLPQEYPDPKDIVWPIPPAQ